MSDPVPPRAEPPRPYANTEAAAANRARLLGWLLGTRAGRLTALALLAGLIAWMVLRTP